MGHYYHCQIPSFRNTWTTDTKEELENLQNIAFMAGLLIFVAELNSLQKLAYKAKTSGLLSHPIKQERQLS